MLIETSIAFIAVTAVWVGLKYHQRRLLAKRRKQMLIQGLNQVSADWRAFKSRLELAKLSELEILVRDVRALGEVLVAALAAQAELGQTVCTPSNDKLLYTHWKRRKNAVDCAQKAYDEAGEKYREFVQSLPPQLRAKARERDIPALAIA